MNSASLFDDNHRSHAHRGCITEINSEKKEMAIHTLSHLKCIGLVSVRSSHLPCRV